MQAQETFGGIQLRSLENMYESVTAVGLSSLLESADEFLVSQLKSRLSKYASTLKTRKLADPASQDDTEVPAVVDPEVEHEKECERAAAYQWEENCRLDDGSGPVDTTISLAEAAAAAQLHCTLPAAPQNVTLPKPKPRAAEVLGVAPSRLKGVRYNGNKPFEAKLFAGLKQCAENGVSVSTSFSFGMAKGALAQHLKTAYFERVNYDFACTAQGRLAGVCGSSTANRCLLSRNSGLKDHQVITGLKARTFGLLSGSVRSKFAGHSNSADCPHCRPAAVIETPSHLLGGCPSMRPFAIQRHDRVVQQLCKDLRSTLKAVPNTLVKESSISIDAQALTLADFTEGFLSVAAGGDAVRASLRGGRPLHEQLEALKHYAPDILIRCPFPDGQTACYLLDVTICNAREEHIREREREKIERYQPMADWLKTQFQAESASVVPIVLTSNGLATGGALTGLTTVLTRHVGPSAACSKTASWMLRRCLEKVVIPSIHKLVSGSKALGSSTGPRLSESQTAVRSQG